MVSRILHLLALRRGDPLRGLRRWLAIVGITACAGCRAVAPLHVWTPPEITSGVGKKVAIAPLAGPQPIAGQIESQLYQTVPRDQGRAIEAITSTELRSKQTLRLASTAGNMPSDLALLPVARQQGIDFLLMGEVLKGRSAKQPSLPNPDQERVSIAWRIYDVAEARPLADRVIVTDSASIADSPESRQQSSGGEAISPAQASGRAVWRLLSPSVQRNHVNLAVPWVLPGSNAVRRGNELAGNGRWPEAERLWRQTLDQHPYQHAARNNLALAAAARQDFSTAKRLIRDAIRQRSKTLYEENLAWIETRQRDYHAAFGLADPPEGWFVTASSPQTP